MQITVASPILGFEHIDRFKLEKIDDFFYTLKAGEIAFTLIEPGKLREYHFDLPPFYAQRVEAESAHDLLVLAIVIVQEPIENSVINFQAPLVINTQKGKLVQVPLDERNYPEYGLAEPIRNYL